MFKIETGKVTGPAVIHAPRKCHVCGWCLPDEITGLVVSFGPPGCCPQGMENREAAREGREPVQLITLEALEARLVEWAGRAVRKAA